MVYISTWAYAIFLSGTWTADFIVKLPKTKQGNDAIMVFVDKKTKLVHFVACKEEIDAPGVARLVLDNIVRLHGMPKQFITDRDVRFRAYWTEFWKIMGTKLNMSTAYHPQTDGQTENTNKTLEQILRSVVDFDQTDWDLHLAAAELAINNSKNATTGYTPFYLFYGQQARLPLDLALAPLLGDNKNPAAVEDTARWKQALEQARENTERAQAIQKRNADRSRRPVTFKVGDMVLVDNEHIKLVGEKNRVRKLTERYLGPWPILEVRGNNAYKVGVPPSMKIHPVFNVSKLKLYRDGVAAFPARPVPLNRPDPIAKGDEEEDEWEVECILDKKKVGRYATDRYLVRWQGYPDSEATWLPIENLTGALDKVIEYNKQYDPDPPAAQKVPVRKIPAQRGSTWNKVQQKRGRKNGKNRSQVNKIEDNFGFFKVGEDVIGGHTNSRNSRNICNNMYSNRTNCIGRHCVNTSNRYSALTPFGAVTVCP